MMIRAKEGGLVSGTLKFELKEQDPDAVFVPIAVK